MNKKTWILILVLILAIAGIVYLVLQKEKRFKVVGIETTNLILNKTDMAYIDTVLYVGLQQLGIRRSVIHVKYMDKATLKRFVDKGQDIRAFIKGKDYQYELYIMPMSRRTSVYILSHELIHVWQYHTGKLNITSESIFWDGQQISPDKYDYEWRPWEVEARRKGRVLEYELMAILYD
jgi:hypothetical protein